MQDDQAIRSAGGYRLLQRASVAVRSQVDLRRVLDTLAADIGRFLDLRLCSLARWDPSGSSLVFSHEYVRDADTARSPSLQGRRFVLGADSSARAFELLIFKDQRTLIRHATAARLSPGRGEGGDPLAATARAGRPAGRSDPDAASAPLLAGLGDSALLVAPIVADQRVTGLIVAGRTLDLPDWTEAEVEFMRAAADVAAVAIQHTALRSRLRALSALAAELNSSLDPPAVLRRLTEAAMSVTQSAMGMAGVLEGDEMVCRELCRDGAWEPIDMRFTRERGLAGWSWTNRAPSIANDAPGDRRADPDLVRAYGVRNAITIPIMDREGTVRGLFELLNKGAGAPYGEEDVHIATAVAHHAAVALELRRT